MPHKGYEESNFSANYSRPPCALDNPQQYIPYTVPLVPNNMYNTQSQNMYDMRYGHQTMHRNHHAYPQNSPSIYQNHVDNNWIVESRPGNNPVDKNLKPTDRMETVEITGKDLSPASFCSNLDLLVPEFYKNVSKDQHYNKMQESQWFYNPNYNNRYNEYSSCAQFNYEDNGMDKTVRYCSIQKQNNLEKSVQNFNSYNYNTDLMNLQTGPQFAKSANGKCFGQENQSDYMGYGQFDKIPEVGVLNDSVAQTDDYYTQGALLCSNEIQFPPIQNIDQRTEASNEESDIIVEESDDEVTDYSEDLEKRIDYPTNCIICNDLYCSTGSQFYILTNTSPLTMASHKAVFAKLVEIVGIINGRCTCICSHCLGLVNTIDHLQCKLDSCRCELFSKFNLTNANSESGTKNLNRTKKRKFKDICKHEFNCKMCKKVFSLKKYYRRHMTRHKFCNRYLCEVCGLRFSKISKFTFHLKHHRKLLNNHKNVVKLEAYLCKLCNKPFRTKTNLKEHENYCSGKLPFACKHGSCSKKFATSTKLKSHVKLKHDKKFASICSICNIGFIRISEYKAHMVSHSTEKKFQCPKCDKSYKTASNLNFHLKFHNKKLPYVCDSCGKGFMRKEYLESHINLHNGIKSFVCQLCDKKFVSQKNLDAHLKYHDGSVKKKSCDICGKLISTGLEDHIRTHNNLREFACDICDMKFNTRNALMKHKKRKHL